MGGVPSTSRGLLFRADLGAVLVGDNLEGGGRGGGPSLRDDDVVEWVIALAEASEADFDDHCLSGEGECGYCGERLELGVVGLGLASFFAERMARTLPGTCPTASGEGLGLNCPSIVHRHS